MSAGLTREWGAFVDWRRVAIVALAVGLPLAAVPLITGEFVLHVLTIGAYYTMLAVSWNLLAGFTGQFSLAQHAFAAVGAYTSGVADLSPEDAARRQHAGRRPHGGTWRLSARSPRAAHAHHLSLDRDLGFRRDLSHRAHRGLRLHARRSRLERAVALRQCA